MVFLCTPEASLRSEIDITRRLRSSCNRSTLTSTLQDLPILAQFHNNLCLRVAYIVQTLWDNGVGRGNGPAGAATPRGPAHGPWRLTVGARGSSAPHARPSTGDHDTGPLGPPLAFCVDVPLAQPGYLPHRLGFARAPRGPRPPWLVCIW